MSRDPGEQEKNDWPEHKMLIIQNMNDCRDERVEQEDFNRKISSRVDDAHNEIRWLRDRIVMLTTGIGTAVGILWGLISDNWEKLFK